MKPKYFLWILTATTAITNAFHSTERTTSNPPNLHFNADHKFHITMFNDLHLGDGARPGTNAKTIDVMTNVLTSEPDTDLVVLNGDLTSCEWLNPDAVNGILDQFMDPLLDRNIPFATTFGNHDMSRTCNTRLMAEHIWDKAGMGSRQLTWGMGGVDGEYNDVGTSNYYLPVYSSENEVDPELKMLLWFFDSKGGRQYQSVGVDVSVADWVDQKVVSWFQLTRDQLQAAHGNKPIPSLAFVHIPPSIAADYQASNERSSSTEPGLDEEILAAQGDQTPGADYPFLTALGETPGLMAVFSGHDHGIDWCMKYSPTSGFSKSSPANATTIDLCFGRHTGYGGYSDWMRGGRHIVADEDLLGEKSLETWIRLEDGSVSGRVTLNSTYGLDTYVPVRKKKSSSFEDGDEDGSSSSSAVETMTTTLGEVDSMTSSGMKTTTRDSETIVSSVPSATEIASATRLSPIPAAASTATSVSAAEASLRPICLNALALNTYI